MFEILRRKCNLFSLYNQPKTENDNKTLPPPPPMFQNTTYIRDVYLYKKKSVEMGSWNTGGTMFYRLKMGEGQLAAREIPV